MLLCASHRWIATPSTTTPSAPPGSEQLCGDNTECIFDAIFVGLDVGAATLEAGDDFEAEVQALGGGELN